ncbi:MULTISPECIES: hypothetical protein [Nocardia]|uniref:hypothetical protein n=1 Tax=Nocardia TaxID=1817 RepID=UPI000D695753|nr:MULTISPECIES: hypothetical protein [Nocardia]
MTMARKIVRDSEKVRRRTLLQVGVTSMILSGGFAYVALLLRESGALVVAAVLSVTFVVQFVGIVVGWRSAPTGAVRVAISGAFVAVGLAILGLVVAALLKAISLFMPGMYLATLFLLVLQGYQCIWRGRA